MCLSRCRRFFCVVFRVVWGDWETADDGWEGQFLKRGWRAALGLYDESAAGWSR
uniref:Uncharacterized protein n=1 Tax=Faecalibaculum rodentium TaxID=1702221 RepID=A0A140DYT2_9FIRM|nr:hypothetical protein AALO17_26750 [Faecalibaculum rodentium]